MADRYWVEMHGDFLVTRTDEPVFYTASAAEVWMHGEIERLNKENEQLRAELAKLRGQEGSDG